MERMVFPKEVTSSVPLITVTGAEEVRVEQHRGLVSYQPEKAVFRTASGMLTITGAEMYFSRYSADEATLSGKINGITMAGTGGQT